MPNVTDIESARKKRKKRRRIQKLISLGVLIGVIVIALSAGKVIGELDPGYLIGEIFSPGTGFPIAIPGSYINEAKSYRGCLGLLSDVNFSAYSPSARQLLNIQHSYSNPAASVNGNMVLIYDRGGTKFKVCDKSTQLYEKQMDYSIISAAVYSDGKAIVSSGAQGFISKVVVYDKSGNEIFKWSSLENYVMFVSFNPGGDGMVVGGVGAKDGGVNTYLTGFRFNSEQELWSYQMEDSIPYFVTYEGNSVIAVTDTAVVNVGSDGAEKSKFDYSDQNLSAFKVSSSGNIALALTGYSIKQANAITVLDSNLNKLGNIDVKDSIRDIGITDNTVAVLTSSGIVQYDLQGQQKGNSYSDVDGSRIACVGDKIYVMTSNGIYQYGS